jgi:hypothetical protein
MARWTFRFRHAHQTTRVCESGSGLVQSLLPPLPAAAYGGLPKSHIDLAHSRARLTVQLAGMSALTRCSL